MRLGTEEDGDEGPPQIRSSRFDPNGVIPRRLISHTAGSTVQVYADYSRWVRLPSLVEVLEGTLTTKEAFQPVLAPAPVWSYKRQRRERFVSAQTIRWSASN
jgi:hypothetical protein